MHDAVACIVYSDDEKILIVLQCWDYHNVMRSFPFSFYIIFPMGVITEHLW